MLWYHFVSFVPVWKTFKIPLTSIEKNIYRTKESVVYNIFEIILYVNIYSYNMLILNFSLLIVQQIIQFI